MVQILLILLIVLAIITLQTQKLRNAVIYLGAFSMCLAMVYFLYHAPDVAIAEAVIGSTLSTILMLVALQKYKIFTIYYHIDSDEVLDTHVFSKQKQQLVKLLEKFCAKQELESQVIYTVEGIDKILHHDYAIIICENEGTIVIYGHPENYKFDAMVDFLNKSHPEIQYIQMKEDVL